jgi:hypothetical protein
MAMSEPLKMWTIYDHPTDYPNQFVARLLLVDNGEVKMTWIIILSDELEALRNHMRRWELTRVPRSPEDEPQIVESWM